MIKALAATLLLGLVTACATGTELTARERATIDRAMAGESQVSGARLDRSVAIAAARPLGSQKNPVRAEMPMGERAYLARLRCSDGKVPQFQRRGSTGSSPYGNIMDIYDVNCGEAAPGRVEVYMDMYHRGYTERQPVPGFTILP